MKLLLTGLSFLALIITACTKSDPGIPEDKTQKILEPGSQINNRIATAATIYNPIVGKWEVGAYKLLCPGTDTLIYENENGTFVDFMKTDTVIYDYNDGSKGISEYTVLDSTMFILGDTMRIINNDGKRLTAFGKIHGTNGGKHWMTFVKPD